MIEVVALDENDEREVYFLKNWEAAVVQHEIDHLNGITILDGAKKRKRLLPEACYQRPSYKDAHDKESVS